MLDLLLRCVSELAEGAASGLSDGQTCRQRAGFLPGQYRPAVASDAGSSRAPFRPPRPIMSTATSAAGIDQPDIVDISQQHPGALSQPARGLGRYSAEVAMGVSEPLCETAEASAAAGRPECLPDKNPPEDPSQLQQQHKGAQGSQGPGAFEVPGQPNYGSPISEQLRAPGIHMRARRRPQLEEAAAQDSQATRTAEHSSGALPAGQTLLPDVHGLAPIEEADPSATSPEEPGALDASAQHQQASRPDVQPPEPGLHSARELSAAELSAAERSAAEQRRQSREFVAQVARESAALQAALAGSTSSSDPSAQHVRADDVEQPAAADEEMCSPDSSPAEAPADAHMPDEASLAAWHGATRPEEQYTMARAEAPQDPPPELLQQQQGPHLESPSLSAQKPQQAALPSELENDMHCVSTRAMQTDGPSMPMTSSPAHSDNEPDILVDLSSPSPVMQQPAVQCQGASQQQAVLHERHAQSSSDGCGTQPRASQPSQPVNHSALSPQQDRARLRLEVRSGHHASPVRLSLNLDLTDSSKQTPANGSSQSAVPEHASPRNILHTAELSQHTPSQPVSVHSLSKDPSQLQHSSAAGEAASMASPQEAHAIQQTPAAAQHEGLQLTDVPLSALHPRGLFTTQAADAAACATPVLLVTSHRQQPRHTSTHDRDGTYREPQTAGNSQDGVDRHSDHSAPDPQSQPMHAQYHRQPDALDMDMETGSPCSPDTAHEVLIAEGRGTQPEQQQQRLQRRQDEDSNEAILHAFKPCRRPPTRGELQASMQELGILGIQHQGAFYGKPADVPERPIGMSLQPTTV